jgi:hypothetical protein
LNYNLNISCTFAKFNQEPDAYKRLCRVANFSYPLDTIAWEQDLYIDKWYKNNYEPYGFNNDFWENFKIVEKPNKEIDLTLTLHSMSGTDLLKIAIDLGVDTPDFIPSIPTFRNELKSDYKTAYDTFCLFQIQFIHNSVTTVGLFLISYYKTKFPKAEPESIVEEDFQLPF